MIALQVQSTSSQTTTNEENIDEKWDMKSHVLTTENMERGTQQRTSINTNVAEWVGHCSVWKVVRTEVD